MKDYKIRVVGVHPIHPGPNRPSYVSLGLSLDHLKSRPYVDIVLSETDALKLASEALEAVRRVQTANARKAGSE